MFTHLPLHLDKTLLTIS